MSNSPEKEQGSPMQQPESSASLTPAASGQKGRDEAGSAGGGKAPAIGGLEEREKEEPTAPTETKVDGKHAERMRVFQENHRQLESQLAQLKVDALQAQVDQLTSAANGGAAAATGALTATAAAMGSNVGKMAAAVALVSEAQAEAVAAKKTLNAVGAIVADEGALGMLKQESATARVPTLQAYKWIVGLDAVRFPTARADGFVSEAQEPAAVEKATAEVSKTVTKPVKVREFVTFDREKVRAMDDQIAQTFVLPQLQANNCQIPNPNVQPAPTAAGVTGQERYGLPRQPHLNPNAQMGIQESVNASKASTSAKKVATAIFTNLNVRYVHLEAWIRVSLNEMLPALGSGGDDSKTTKQCMAVIRVALRQYRQSALAETQFALGVVSRPPAQASQADPPLLSVTTSVANENSTVSGGRVREQLAANASDTEDSPSKRPRAEVSNREGERTGALPESGAASGSSAAGSVHAGAGRDEQDGSKK